MSALSRRAFISVATASLLTAAAPARADDKTPLSTFGVGSKYAKKHKALSMIIVHGPVEKGHTPQDIAEGFSSAVSSKNVPVRAYFVPGKNMRADEMSVAFTNGYTSHGPMGLDKIGAAIPEIVDSFKRYNRLVSRTEIDDNTLNDNSVAAPDQPK